MNIFKKELRKKNFQAHRYSDINEYESGVYIHTENT